MSRKKPQITENIDLADSLKAKFVVRGKKITDKQRRFLDLCTDLDTKVVFVSGPAGSTKTYMAVMSALRILQKDEELDLLYVRTAIESADKGLGALPGTLEDKFNPYMAPLEDKLIELLPPTNSLKDDLVESGRVQAMPINFLRGASWNNKVVIADESQNFSFKELVTLITRIGDNSKLFICGDPMQSDINGKSGFKPMFDLFNDEESRENGIHTFVFTERDILRSKILKFIVKKLKTL
jgi:phosphate starvation-inducible PhoH-like protein